MAAPVPPTGRRLQLREQLHLVDYAILFLAFLSLLVFVLDRTDKLTGGDITTLRTIDLVLVALYGAAFAFKWIVAERRLRWLRRNALNALGAFPLTFPLFFPEKYFIVVQVIIVILRTGEALDRAFGARVLRGLFDRYQYMVVEELTDPLLMRLAIVLEDAVTSRDYAAAIGKRLDERRDLVEAAVKRAIHASPKLSRISEFGPVSNWIDETTEEMVDALHAALTGPELNTIIREGLQDAFAELKQGIAEKKWRERGVGVAEVGRGLVRV
jgi:hypothetical protein